jgi:hypothetical protein
MAELAARTRDKRKKPSSKPIDLEKRCQEIMQKGLWTADDLEHLPSLEWVIPDFIPKRGVVMTSGPQGSLKSNIIMGAGMSVVYAEDWHDGTKLEPGIFAYVTEDETLVKNMRIAWLRAHNKPLSGHDGFRCVNSKKYRRNDAKGKPAGRMDPTNAETIDALIADLKATAKSERTSVKVVVIDPLTHYCSRLDDPVARALLLQMYRMAEELECGVVLINHTHKRSSRVSQGSYVLETQTQGNFFALRDREWKMNGVKTGLRAYLVADRIKGGIEDPTEWIGTPIRLAGVRQKLCSMTCVGTVAEVTTGLVAENRVLIAISLPPGSDVSLYDCRRRCGLEPGGNQYKDLRTAVPDTPDGIVVHIPDKNEWRRLRRYKKGKYEHIVCEHVNEPPKSREEKPEPRDEPETATVKARSKSAVGKGHLTTIQCGDMPERDYLAALDAHLGEEYRVDEFRTAIDAMVNKGAVLTDAGKQLLAWMKVHAAKGVEGMTLVANILKRSPTVRLVMKTATVAMRRQARKG